MPVIKTQDRADAFRIVIEGRLAGESVQQVASLWSEALAECLPRKIRVDISLLTGYDAPGRKLLRDLHLHGTEFAAGTPESLTFLADVTAPRRRGVTVLPENLLEPVQKTPVPQKTGQAGQPLRMRAAAGN